MKHVSETGRCEQLAMGYFPMQPNGMPLQVNDAITISGNDCYRKREILVAVLQRSGCPGHQSAFLSGCTQLAGSKHQRQWNG
jgi:hypothetical protein